MAVFADLDLRAGSDLKALRGLVENAAHLGYSVVAINHVVEFKEKKQEIEKPVAVSELFTTLPIVQGKSRPIKVLTRLTIIVSDPSHCNVLVACTHLDVDLVCITVTEKLPFYFKRPPINVVIEVHLPGIDLDDTVGCVPAVLLCSLRRPLQPGDFAIVHASTLQMLPTATAIDRGVGFELVYSPAIKDSTMRRYTISNALNLMQVCKGKNVIISSAAERPLEIRGPYDVANLGLLFGLTESDARAAVSTNCRAALLHGETRKTAFGIISTVKKPRPSEADDDSLPACKKAKCEG
ncbi:ribonuclease P protein subunit p30 isoform X2 [Suricata suricatta]|uniref:ribonuclease P protein subunit p30 isoform X2 n=1 Tax=Suricata suricatta TaxID=37032 RepID=UPI001155CDC6|nr:ribonuclease P protein subunit p30 isoform X2 [Suricata suricatta]